MQLIHFVDAGGSALSSQKKIEVTPLADSENAGCNVLTTYLAHFESLKVEKWKINNLTNDKK